MFADSPVSVQLSIPPASDGDAVAPAGAVEYLTLNPVSPATLLQFHCIELVDRAVPENPAGAKGKFGFVATLPVVYAVTIWSLLYAQMRK